MKTLVSRLSVACHQRSGKYRTCRTHQWGPTALAGVPGVPSSPWTHLPWAQGALQRALGRWQGGIRVLEPGQRRLVGVEVRGFIGRVQKPALENTRGTSPPNSPPAPRAQPQGGLPRGQGHLLGAVSFPLPQILPLGLSSHLPAENHLRETRAVPVEGNARARACGGRGGWCWGEPPGPPHPLPQVPIPHPPAIPKL